MVQLVLPLVVAYRHGAEALALLRRLLKWARCDCGIECNCGPYTGSAACGHECQCGCEALRAKARALLAEADRMPGGLCDVKGIA